VGRKSFQSSRAGRRCRPPLTDQGVTNTGAWELDVKLAGPQLILGQAVQNSMDRSDLDLPLGGRSPALCVDQAASRVR
jgi:hypothetical protein